MYIRFVTGQTDPDAGLQRGIFQCALEIWYGDGPVESWIKDEIRRSLDWFNDHLDRPKRLSPRRRRSRSRSGVCWFTPDANRHLAKAHYLAWLVSEGGTPVQRLRSIDPGEIIWRDAYQIVAVQNRTGPIYL